METNQFSTLDRRRAKALHELHSELEEIRGLQPWESEKERDARMSKIRRMEIESMNLRRSLCPHPVGTPEWDKWWAENPILIHA